MLDHFCVSLGTLVREWPELREVRVGLEALDALDDASIASLMGAIQVASSAQVAFCVDGYSVGMARLAMAGGIDAKHLGTPRPASAYPRELLH